MNMQLLFAGMIAAIALYGYISYAIDIKKRRIHPRPITWFVWGVLNTVVAIVQLRNGAELGALSTIFGAVFDFLLAGLALYYGHRVMHPIDKLTVWLVGLLIAGWWLLPDSLFVVCAGAIFAIGFLPTIDRIYKYPFEEKAQLFSLNAVRYVLAIVITAQASLETILYPVILASANVLFVTLLLYRRTGAQTTHRKR